MLEWTLFVATAAVLPWWSLSAGWVVSRDGKVYVLCYPLNDFCTFQIISIELTLFSVAQRPSFLLATKPIFVELYFYYLIRIVHCKCILDTDTIITESTRCWTYHPLVEYVESRAA